jgi:hypothetical protein
MTAVRNRKHLIMPRAPSAESYTPHRPNIRPRPIPAPRNRRSHADRLKSALLRAGRDVERERQRLGVTVHGAEPGLYVQFESQPNIPLKLESMEDRGAGIELVAVQHVEHEGQRCQVATVFIPDGKLKGFVHKIEEYATKTTAKGEPRHKDLFDRIASLRRATLRAVWTDTDDAWPADDEKIWWEVWLRRDEGNELARLLDFAHQSNLQVGERRLAFTDRTVVLVRASAAQLAISLEVLNDLAEVRRAKETPGFFASLKNVDRAEWIADLVRRTTPPGSAAPAVCILDTGVNRGHPLLEGLIQKGDAMSVDAAWGAHDDGGGPGNMGHGTEMAGIAGYGDLVPVLAASTPVTLSHRVESVKILPPRGANRKDLYGAITAQAVALPEINAPDRARTFSLAVTSTDQRDRGQPTAWSAAIDALAAGRSFDNTTSGLVYFDNPAENPRRLFVVSAGNHDHVQLDHLVRSDLEPIHDPAQAWNALTVGAFTDRAVIRDPHLAGWSPVSRSGDLAPWSTTSVGFQEMWPIKPDVVFEGGNAAHESGSFRDDIPDLGLLTTGHKPAENPFSYTGKTSAAAAQVARLAAMVGAEYQDLWPETIRGLIVHSARWTRAMEAHLRGSGGRKLARLNLARRYGAGVPSLERALRSANDAVTLIVQSTIHPFANGRMREMHLHELPWPRAVLEQLGSASVRLRVTLSYFVEPNPGRRGWKRRHRYASHGLRFAVRGRAESTPDFRKRLNQQALDEDEEKPGTDSDSEQWFLGEARNKGSLHSDTLTGFAVDLAARGVIGVYPVSGWWKEQPKRDRSEQGARYALIVGIETDVEDVDIWTPIAQEIGIPVSVAA